MLCIPILGPGISQAKKQIQEAEKIADLLEFRLDSLTQNTEELNELRAFTKKPAVLSHGDSAMACEYLDIADAPLPKTSAKVIRSYHNFETTPTDLDSIYSHYQGGDFVKIATLARSSLDSMRMLLLVQNMTNLIGLCMGEYGQFSRILAPIVGSPISFAALSEDDICAPGQLTAEELIETYHFRRLSQNTRIFALLGDPVAHSQSHITHNRFFRENGHDAIFVKIRLRPEELQEFFALAKQLPFEGFAVTKPLKEAILPFVDHFESGADQIGAVNTLRIRNGKIHAMNSDGIGTLNLLEAYGSVAGKRIVILGAGGAAKAIAWEAKRRGASLHILNRHPERAKQIAASLQCEFGTLPDFSTVAKKGYDILINATSASRDPGYDTVVDPALFLEDKIMMDVVNADFETPFIAEAKKKQCRCVTGNDMFLAQAEPQFDFWFDKV